MKYKPIYVRWLDHSASTSAEWQPLDELKGTQPVTMESLGFLLREEKDFLVVISSLSEHMGRSEVCILKNCILKRKYVRL